MFTPRTRRVRSHVADPQRIFRSGSAEIQVEKSAPFAADLSGSKISDKSVATSAPFGADSSAQI